MKRPDKARAGESINQFIARRLEEVACAEFPTGGGLAGNQRSENPLMSILSPDPKKDANDVVPPAALGVILHADPRTLDLLNGKDRFGFPLHATLLERYDKRPELEVLARDVVDTLSRLLGPAQARDVLMAALRQPPTGKQANLKENAALLAAFDAEIAANTPLRRAARRAAEKMVVMGEDPESIAKQIRRLVQDRQRHRAEEEKARARVEAWFRACGPSLLERATGDTETDL